MKREIRNRKKSVLKVVGIGGFVAAVVIAAASCAHSGPGVDRRIAEEEPVMYHPWEASDVEYYFTRYATPSGSDEKRFDKPVSVKEVYLQSKEGLCQVKSVTTNLSSGSLYSGLAPKGGNLEPIPIGAKNNLTELTIEYASVAKDQKCALQVFLVP